MTKLPVKYIYGLSSVIITIMVWYSGKVFDYGEEKLITSGRNLVTLSMYGEGGDVSPIPIQQQHHANNPSLVTALSQSYSENRETNQSFVPFQHPSQSHALEIVSVQRYGEPGHTSEKLIASPDHNDSLLLRPVPFQIYGVVDGTSENLITSHVPFLRYGESGSTSQILVQSQHENDSFALGTVEEAALNSSTSFHWPRKVSSNGPAIVTIGKEEISNPNDDDCKDNQMMDCMVKKVQKHKETLKRDLLSAQKKRSIQAAMDGGGKPSHPIRINHASSPPTREEVVKEFQRAKVRLLREGDEPFTSKGLSKYFPRNGLLNGQHFNTCALISSAGAMKGSGLGQFIDSHDVVLRFNDAPTKGFESDVGSKTSIRIINEMVLYFKRYNFNKSPMYREGEIVVWGPCRYEDSLRKWFNRPNINMFPRYFGRRRLFPEEKVHILHPQSMWEVWRALQSLATENLPIDWLTTGMLGIVMMMAQCSIINVFEFLPSLRMTDQCHYYQSYLDIGCTYGTMHPRATEKLIVMALNEADDMTTYRDGYVTIRGFDS